MIDHAIRALAAGQNITEAAAAQGISVRSIKRRMLKPGYQEDISLAKSLMLQEVANKLVSSALEGVEILRSGMRGELPGGTQSTLRVRSAESAISASLKVVAASEFESRLRKLEITDRPTKPKVVNLDVAS